MSIQQFKKYEKVKYRQSETLLLFIYSSVDKIFLFCLIFAEYFCYILKRNINKDIDSDKISPR